MMFQIALTISVVGLLFWFLLNGFVLLCQLVWTWIDDGEYDFENWLLKKMHSKMKRFDFVNNWYGLGAIEVFFFTTIFVVLAPLVTCFFIWAWPLGLFLLAAGAIVFTARAGRRLSKRFHLHEKDETLHKKPRRKKA